MVGLDDAEVGDAALLVHQNKAEGKLGVRCLAPSEGLGVTNPEKRAKIGEDKITLFQRHARGEL
jgi:crotonyl-CoA reductase